MKVRLDLLLKCRKGKEKLLGLMERREKHAQRVGRPTGCKCWIISAASLFGALGQHGRFGPKTGWEKHGL